MKYRVVLDVVYSDDTSDKVAIYTYDTEDSALSGYYKYMGQYVGAEKVKSVNVICKSSTGMLIRNDSWESAE